jgi:hypothetical protein
MHLDGIEPCDASQAYNIFPITRKLNSIDKPIVMSGNLMHESDCVDAPDMQQR